MTAPVPPLHAIPLLDFIQRIKDSVRHGQYRFRGTDLHAEGVEVTGPIDFASLIGPDFEKEVLIEGVRFGDAVKMDGCTFGKAVTFKSCSFANSIDLGKAVFRNGVSFIECVCGEGAALGVTKVILDDAKIRGDVTFFKVDVKGCISARRLRLAGNLEFSACTVAGDSRNGAVLDATDCKIKGSVIFETGRSVPPDAQAANQPQNTAAAPVKSGLPRSFFHNLGAGGTSVLLRGAEVTDLVKLGCARFEGELDLAFIKCRGLTSEADIYVCRQDERNVGATNQTSIAERETFGGARIDGVLTLSGGEFGLIHLHGICVSREMMLIAGKSGQINIEDSVYPGGNQERFVATSRLGHFIMSSWQCSEYLHLHAAEVIGNDNASRVRGIVIKSSVIERTVSFWPGLMLQRSLESYLVSNSAETTPQKFLAVRSDGSLATASDPICRNLLNRWCRQLVLRGNISIDHCSIGDDLLLTGIDLIGESKSDDGRIEIVDSKIDGNLVFRSPVSFLADAQVDAPLLRLFAQRLVVADPDKLPRQDQAYLDIRPNHNSRRQQAYFVPAFCHAIDTSGLQATKIDLTGLCVRKPLSSGPGDPANAVASRSPGRRDVILPNAVMSYLKVHGKVATFARLSEQEAAETYNQIAELTPAPNIGAGRNLQNAPPPQPINWARELLTVCCGARPDSIALPDKRLEASADISGALDLQYSEIGELLISDVSFREHAPEGRAADSGIVLDYAQISKLYVARSEIQTTASPQHNGFPVPVSLLDLSVKTWFLEDDEASSSSVAAAYVDQETTIAEPYLDLLENDPAFRMSSYLAIEKSLRDRGLTDEAREIFIAGNYRDVRTESVKNQPATDHDRQPAQPNPGTAAPAEKIPLPGLRPATWRNWKVWRRAEGRYRGSTVDDIHRLLKSPDYRALARCLMACLAILLAAALVLIERSLISVGYVAIVFLSLFPLFTALFRQRGWQDGLMIGLCLVWFFAAFYALVEIIMQPSFVGFGYLAIVLLSFCVATGPFGLPAARREHLGVVVYGVCVGVGSLAVGALLLAPLLPVATALLAFVYLLIVLCLFFTLRGNLFRLWRPRREYLGFALCLAWCAVAAGLSAYAVTGPSFIGFGALALWLALLFPLFAAMRCFLDQLYWSLVDYGTSALRLAGVIFVLMALSFAFVSDNPENFEATLLAKSIPLDKKPVQHDKPTADDWVFGERVWMTLRYHVPLVGAVVSDEWQPAGEPLRFKGLTDKDGKIVRPSWWPTDWIHRPRARDWYGAMLWMNWLLWPLFLPFLIHKLSRER